MSRYYKIGFHTGPGGNRAGIGEHWQALDSAGIPAIHISVDEAGTCYELDRLAKASNVPHVNVYRICDKIPGFNADVPDYALEPRRAAEIWASAILQHIPPELEDGLRNGRIWLIAGNEVDKNRASWLGYWAKEVCLIMNPLGYRIAAFGWSSGEPEYDDWTEPGMAEYLRYCDMHPDHAALAVHEYSYTMNLADGLGYKVGRFTFIEEACHELGIHTPNIFITEFGWTYQDVPSPSDCMAQMAPIAELYADHPAVQGAMLWYLGPGFGDISNQVQRLIAPVTDESLRWGYTPGEPPVEPPVEPPEEDFVDFAEYFAPKPGVSHGPIYMIYNNWGQGPERTHLARSPMGSPRHFYVTKNNRWERRYIGDHWVWLQADTSRANNEFYTVDGDPWLPRIMKIGNSFTRREQTEIYHLDSCNHINSGGMTSDIKLIGYDTSFEDMVGDRPVVKMAWVIDGIVEEYYWYCKHVGLVGWSNKRGYASRIREFVPTNEQPNPVSWRCSVLNEKPPTNIPEPPEPPTNPILIQGWDTTVEMQVTGIDGIRLNALAGIQQVIHQDSIRDDLHLQVVTSEVTIDDYVFQAAESLTSACPRRVYVWQSGEDVYWFNDPHSE